LSLFFCFFCFFLKEKKESLHIYFLLYLFFVIGAQTGMLASQDNASERHHLSPRAQHAFKISMVHGVLQFTLRIAVCCVLHRCESRDIHCWELIMIRFFLLFLCIIIIFCLFGFFVIVFVYFCFVWYIFVLFCPLN